MELFKLLLEVSLIFISVKGAASLVYCRRDSQPIEQKGYNLNLTIYINENDYKNTHMYKKFKSYIDEQRAKGNFIFYGESTMFFRFTSSINRLCLYAFNLEIDETEIKLIYSPDGVNDVYIPTSYSYDDFVQIVGLMFRDIFELNHTYRLYMKFVGSITDNAGGFVKTSYINNKGEKRWVMTAANFQGVGARQIFPCWDEPDLRTKFTISITHPRNYRVLSNSPIDREFTDGNSMIGTRFKTTDNISPYHLAIVLSELYQVPNRKVWCRQYVEHQTKFALRVVVDAITYLYAKQTLLDDAETPPKVDHVIIPGFQDNGLESWGLVLYKEAAVIYDEKLDVVSWKFEVARMVARKMAHQLVGNLIGQSWWSDMWINEGIATFLAMNIVKEFIHPHLMDLLVVQFQRESFQFNDYYDMPLDEEEIYIASNIHSLFSFTLYVKAPLIVRIISQTVSEERFYKGLNKYLITYQLAPSMHNLRPRLYNTIGMFLEALQEAPVQSNEPIINLTERINEWTYQKRYPVLQVTQESQDMVEIKLQEYLNRSYPNKLWIPVTYTTQSTFNITKKGWLSPQKPILHLTDIKKNDWVIVNVQQSGYYRVNYDNNNWQKLMTYLSSTEYFNIHVLNRAQIIDDAYYFLKFYFKNKLDFWFFKNLTLYLSSEKNYIAWYPMFKIMEEISGFFPFPQSTEVKEHFREILDSVLRKIKYNFEVESREDAFTKCLRQEAAKWACILNSEQCVAVAYLELWHAKKPSLYVPLPGWKEWTYCKGLMSANNIIWNKVLNGEVLNNKLLEFLACTKNYINIIDYFDKLKSGYFTEAQHRITVFHSIIARHAKNNLILDYILQNFANVIPSEIKPIIAITDIINNLYSTDQLDKAYDCAQRNFSEEMFSYVIDKINLRTSQISKHVRYFERFLKAE